MTTQREWLEQRLLAVRRRYAIPDRPQREGPWADHPASRIAVALDTLDRAVLSADVVSRDVRESFVEALDGLIREALHPITGDGAFQALVLRRQSEIVQEYAALLPGVKDDLRTLTTVVNRHAHPEKLARMPAGEARASLDRLQRALVEQAWERFRAEFLVAIERDYGTSLSADLQAVIDGPALQRLQRFATLSTRDSVRQYLALQQGQGPRAGSEHAFAQGVMSKRRGVRVEERAATVLQEWADRLNALPFKEHTYRVVTSVYADTQLPGRVEHAKGEWDAMLLSRSDTESSVWNVMLIVEVKAAVDAASGDLPRLIRGLHVLASAIKTECYTFSTAQGPVQISGESLSQLPTQMDRLQQQVLYCSDANADEPTRLLSHASRMQLLSLEPSVLYATRLSTGDDTNRQYLYDVWDHLLQPTSGQVLRQQYQWMFGARGLMVHIDDLRAAAASD